MKLLENEFLDDLVLDENEVSNCVIQVICLAVVIKT